MGNNSEIKVITLTTDFGIKDPYVAIMKGVILSINPHVHIIDISHEVKPGNIIEGACLLQDSYNFFPKGTIHVGVIDPGVGGNRRPIVVQTTDYFFVGPDNGLFWPIINNIKKVKIFHILEKRYFLSEISSTFHGRDIFSPVAAYISKGVTPDKLGKIIHNPVALKLDKPILLKDKIIGHVIRSDRFGNLITNISKEDIIKVFGNIKVVTIKIGKVNIPYISRTYSEVKPKQLLALIGSSGRLEISANLASAHDTIGKDILKKEEIILEKRAN